MIEYLLRKHLRGHVAAGVLDVGPGYGPWSRVAADITGARRVTFLDVDPAVLAWQAAEARQAGIEPSSVELALTASGIARALEQVDARFDLILCQEVLEHLVEAEAVLAALAERLAPGGRVVITVPTAISERWLGSINPAYMKDEPHGHVRQFDRRALTRLVEGAGLALRVLEPAQPHYFLAHTFMFGTRMPVAGATGVVGGANGARTPWRSFAAQRIGTWSRKLFMGTSPEIWSRLLPRNYFAVAEAASG